MLGGASVLSAFLALPRSPDHDACRRSAARIVLAIVLLYVVVNLIVDIVMLLAPDLSRSSPRDRSSGGSFYPATGWRRGF
ncbi:hypothetical protein D3C76_1669830 [compost metagenome]